MTTPYGEEAENAPGATAAGAEEAGTAFASDAPRSLPAPLPEPPRPERASVFSGWLAAFVVVVVIGGGMHLAFDLDRAGALSFWFYAIAPTVLVAAFALFRAYQDGELGELVRPAWGDATRGLLSAALLFGATVAFIRFAAPQGSNQVSWLARIYLQIGDPTWLRAHAGAVAFLVLLAAAAEEVVWRGLVTRLIAEQIGSRSAWVWAAVPYALAQVPSLWALRDPVAGLNPLLVVAALVLGLVWGGMARQSRRLVPSILSHGAYVWCVIMVFRLW